MSKQEAERFVAQSVFKDTVFHTTKTSNVNSLLSSGFNLQYRDMGRLWGDGVYLSLDETTKKCYEKLFKPQGSATTLELKVNIKKPFVLDFIQNNEPLTPLAVVKKLPNGDERYKQIVTEFQQQSQQLLIEAFKKYKTADERELFLRSVNYQRDVRPTALTKLLQEYGYDALIIKDIPEGVAGGNQIIVFNANQG
jgi:hypothetical protein